MTIDQQLRDRFDRETSTGVPEPDLAAAIAAGRRRRRGRAASYAVGSLAVAAVAAAVVIAPRLGADPVPTLAAHDGTFVPGTPFTDSVEYAYVSTANATASELIASACRLTLANVSHASW